MVENAAEECLDETLVDPVAEASGLDAFAVMLEVFAFVEETPGDEEFGFALFGISLAKLFVYDLAFLSSVARAFSFLAVGAVLLVGGFFYQRLAVDSRA